MNRYQGQAGTWILAAIAMIAFATNSVLCRMALGGRLVDAAGFTAIRLASGAVMLALLTLALRSPNVLKSGSWLSGFYLFLYAVAFSFSYLRLSAGTGALILFGCVQATMIIAGLRRGERPHPLQWTGLAAALAGLFYLVFPGLHAPSIAGSLLMAVAGIAWGLYSLRGRGVKDPVAQTAGNFLRAVPFSLIVLAGRLHGFDPHPRGVLLAVVSGALASGIGYAVWYTTLRGLSATRAAAVQLSVPVLAAFGGVIFLAEQITVRLLIASFLILGGVALTVIARERSRA